MKNNAGLKYVFNFSSVFLLVLMLFLSRNAGISCDEVLHYNHSISVYNYFASHGKDQSALNTPVSNLKFYGQSYDNVVTILTKWFKIEDVYRFRHLMSSLAGWLTIYITALFAIWLVDYRAGIIVLALFAISPTFMGHSQNNLKDIPFTLACISGIFFMLKYLVSVRKESLFNIILLTLSLGFALSIRAGGLLLLCYLFFFLFVFYFLKYFKDKRINPVEIRKRLLLIFAVSFISWIISILLWPFALQSPFRNIIESYKVMAHFPSSFRQIFEGRFEWSDYMPWYYIPKSVLITVPLVILTGVIFFVIILLVKNKDFEKKFLYGCLIFTVLFPLIFVVYEKSNVYSSWRQFLFIYPGIVILSATGILRFYEFIKVKYFRTGMIIILIVFSVHPLKYMYNNPRFYYIYYNELVGGLNGAYSNYETDYYYTGQTSASEWLIEYLRNRNSDTVVNVRATFPVDWQFRHHPKIRTSYFRFEERSQFDWDYAIVTNRYITPFQLKKKIWPPANTIHTVYADYVPICVVLERKSKDDYLGYQALRERKYKDAIAYFEKAVKSNTSDEMIFYNFAAALYNDGNHQKADSLLKTGLTVNPDSEPILMYMGNIAKAQNKPDLAIKYYERAIEANRKYFEAYVSAAELLAVKDVVRARGLLFKCLNMSPKYKKALIALADSYRSSNPEIADKYDELANGIK